MRISDWSSDVCSSDLIFVVRKSKAEIIEMIIAWAALESMAARLAAERATSEELHALRQIFEQFEDEAPAEHMSEYSEANIAFHQTILRLSRSPLAAEMTENLDRKSTRLNSSH